MKTIFEILKEQISTTIPARAAGYEELFLIGEVYHSFLTAIYLDREHEELSSEGLSVLIALIDHNFAGLIKPGAEIWVDKDEKLVKERNTILSYRDLIVAHLKEND